MHVQDEQLSFLGFLDQPNQRRTRVDDCEEGISAFQFESAGPLPAVSDKWVLASNLQKAIRRGLKDVAISTAIKLVGMDAAYFWRRLLVIGYEDVGFGDLPLCASLLGTFRRTALHRRLGVEKVAGYFADRLCSAVKSRALCDAIAMLEFSVKLRHYEEHGFTLSAEELVDSACNAACPPMDRVAALRHLCGYRRWANGRYQTATRAQPDLLRRVAEQCKLSDTESLLFLSGQNVSESLNIPIPLVAQMLRASAEQVLERHSEQRFAGIDGIQFCALDRHTRWGKHSFALLLGGSTSLQRFFSRRPGLDPVKVIGATVFIIEGSKLDRWLVFDGSDQLRSDFEWTFMEHAGMKTPGEAQEIQALVREELICSTKSEADTWDNAGLYGGLGWQKYGHAIQDLRHPTDRLRTANCDTATGARPRFPTAGLTRWRLFAAVWHEDVQHGFYHRSAGRAPILADLVSYAHGRVDSPSIMG